jgi:hypothetical protein
MLKNFADELESGEDCHEGDAFFKKLLADFQVG